MGEPRIQAPEPVPGRPQPPIRLGTVADAAAAADLHAEGIAEGFLVVLGPRFLRRLYRRIVRSSGAALLVAEDEVGVTGFVAVAADTGRLYREFLVHDGVLAGAAAAPAIARAPRHVWETLRYGTSDDAALPRAEILSVAVATRARGTGLGTRLVEAGIRQLHALGQPEAQVVTATDNAAALRMYEKAGFVPVATTEVHRGSPQQVLVCR